MTRGNYAAIAVAAALLLVVLAMFWCAFRAPAQPKCLINCPAVVG